MAPKCCLIFAYEHPKNAEFYTGFKSVKTIGKMYPEKLFAKIFVKQ
jgi:hypothetical protein